MDPIRQVPAPAPTPPAPPPTAPAPTPTTPMPTAPTPTDLAVELLWMELLLSDPFFAPLLGVESDEVALLEAEQAAIDQAALAAGLGVNVNMVA